MPLRIKTKPGSNLLEVLVSGKITKEDYEQFTPKSEELIKEHGKIDCLLVMQDFHGWEVGALWEDIKFDIKHFRDIERLAMVGEKKWQKWMADFCRPFTTAQIRYYQQHEGDQARTWLATAEPASLNKR